MCCKASSSCQAWWAEQGSNPQDGREQLYFGLLTTVPSPSLIQ